MSDWIPCELVLHVRRRLRIGAALLPKEDFLQIVKEQTGTDAYRAERFWLRFRSNPLGYLASRENDAEARALAGMILKLATESAARTEKKAERNLI